MAAPRAVKKYIIGLDIGTSRSGFSVCVVHGPDNVFEIAAYAADSVSRASETKSETVLTIVGDTDYIGPGYYLNEQAAQTNGHFAKNFKMLLDVKSRGRVVLRDTMVTLHPLVNGRPAKRMPLLEVFTRYIRVAGRMGFQKLTEHCATKGFETPQPKDVFYVVTVPAIWTDQARIFMREAVNAAGLVGAPIMSGSQVGICLEPEGAALQCIHEFRGNKHGLVGEKIMIIDLGGGTADITYHTVSSYVELGDIITLDELRPPSGGPWGGRLVNDRFDKLVMKPLLGPLYKTHYKANEGSKSRFHHDQFEDVKKTFSHDTDTSRSVILAELLEELEIDKAQLLINELNLGKPPHLPPIKLVGVKLFLSPEWIKHFYLASLEPVFAHLRSIVTHDDKPKYVFLSGGMSDNDYVASEMNSFFRHYNVNVLRPSLAGIAIAKGAVRFGFNKKPFALRIARTNYGTDVINHDDPSRPRFSKLVSKGADLRQLAVTMARSPASYSPVREDQTSITFRLYECEDDITHIDHPNCYYIAKVELPVSDLVPFSERRFHVKISMSDTVISGTFTEVSTGNEKILEWSSR